MSDNPMRKPAGAPLRERLVLPFTLVVLVVVWQISVSLFHLPSYLLPSPSDIGIEVAANWMILLQNTWVTTVEVLLGFAMSVALAIPIAVLVSYSKLFKQTVYPLIVGSQTIPKVALAPLMLVWFGFGLAPKVAIVVLVAFFPIVINAVVGFNGISPQMLYLASSMGATPWQSFWRFRLPNALPNLFAGLKVAAILAVIGAIVAEFVGADSGLGYLVLVSGTNFKIAEQFAAIILLSIMGTAFFWLASWTERKLLPWHVSVRSSEGR